MKNKPNIVFLFSDQQRWDTLGCYGQSLNISPNLDAMANEGVLYQNAFTCQPVCGPARACLQTGKYATELGCYKNGIELPQDQKTMAHWFTEAGYETAYIGKWHLATTKGKNDFRTAPIPLERRGGYSDYWMASDVLEFTSHGYDGHVFNADMEKVDFKGYRVDCITDFALDFLNSRDEEKPFFMFVSYIEPHHQNDHNRYEGPIGSKEKFKDFNVPKDLEDIEGDYNKEFPDYLGCCASLDENVGRIRAELEKLGLSDDTIIVYTSDHGSHFKTRNKNVVHDDYKRCCHEGAIHIPMIIYGPEFKGGKVIDNLVSLLDLPPTLLTTAGIKAPEYMRGKPLQEIEDSNNEWAKEVFIQISEIHVSRAIRTKRWKYCIRAHNKDGMLHSGSDIYTEDYLYDLENDPHEQQNLVNDPDYIQTRRELSERIKVRMHEAGETIPEILPIH
jgi:uncharacterized sulfatase